MPDLHPAFAADAAAAKPVWFVDAAGWDASRSKLPASARAYAEAAAFKPEAGTHLLVPGADGAVAGCLFAVEEAKAKSRDPFLAGKLAGILPAGVGTVHDSGLCTMCDERFFSHRRGRGITGRQAGIAWRA